MQINQLRSDVRQWDGVGVTSTTVAYPLQKYCFPCPIGTVPKM